MGFHPISRLCRLPDQTMLTQHRFQCGQKSTVQTHKSCILFHNPISHSGFAGKFQPLRAVCQILCSDPPCKPLQGMHFIEIRFRIFLIHASVHPFHLPVAVFIKKLHHVQELLCIPSIESQCTLQINPRNGFYSECHCRGFRFLFFTNQPVR